MAKKEPERPKKSRKGQKRERMAKKSYNSHRKKRKKRKKKKTKTKKTEKRKEKEKREKRITIKEPMGQTLRTYMYKKYKNVNDHCCHKMSLNSGKEEEDRLTFTYEERGD